MESNYLLQEVILKDNKDLDNVDSLLERFHSENKSKYIDEMVLNVFVYDESVLKECLAVISSYNFGILRRVPLVNLYFNTDNIYSIKDLDNAVKNFITPVLQVDLAAENIVQTVEDAARLFEEKGWKMQLLLNAGNVKEFEQGMKLYNILKCEFFQHDFNIFFRLAENKDLLKAAYMNMSYVMDTLKFLGMRNNIIIESLLKALREKETGIHQEFNHSYKDIVKSLMQFDTEKYYGKKTLIRETMDDFAMV